MNVNVVRVVILISLYTQVDSVLALAHRVSMPVSNKSLKYYYHLEFYIIKNFKQFVIIRNLEI